MTEITPANVEFYFLSFIRVFTLVSVLPVIGYESINIRVKILFSFFFTAVVFPFAIYNEALLAGSVASFFVYVLNEIAAGLIIGVIPVFLFYAFQFAGDFLSMQMGLSMTQAVDPTTQTNITIIGKLNYVFVMMIFFIIGGHLFFIEAIVKSFEVIPLGAAAYLKFGDILAIVGRNIHQLIVTGIKAGAPILISLFVVESALGIMARTVPQMNIFIVGIPLKIFVGFSLLILILGYVVRVFIAGFATIQNDVFTIINLLGVT